MLGVFFVWGYFLGFLVSWGRRFSVFFSVLKVEFYFSFFVDVYIFIRF